MEITLILVCAVLDRLRGDAFDVFSRTFEKALYGAVVGVLAGAESWHLVVFSVLFALGASPGWGTPMGAYYRKVEMGPEFEWWQFGPFRRHALAALALRGVIWAIAIAPACWLIGNPWPALAVTIAVPLSAVIAGFSKRGADKWHLGEIYRGALVGAITALALV